MGYGYGQSCLHPLVANDLHFELHRKPNYRRTRPTRLARLEINQFHFLFAGVALIWKPAGVETRRFPVDSFMLKV